MMNSIHELVVMPHPGSFLHSESTLSAGPNFSKINPDWAARLRELPRQQKVQAVLLLSTKPRQNRSGFRQSSVERSDRVATNRTTAQNSLAEVDLVLQKYRGVRLAESVNALGTIPVETTPAGLFALAELDQVSAILENQGISLLQR